MKLKAKSIPEHRERILKEQGGNCPLCGRQAVSPCLDHNHKHGFIRGVLCRTCNGYEGRISNNAARHCITDLPAYLENLAAYLRKHATDQTGLLHPTFRTPEEKKARAKKRRDRKSRVTKSTTST